MITLLVADEDHVGGGRQVMSVGHGPHHDVSLLTSPVLLAEVVSLPRVNCGSFSSSSSLHILT